MNPLAPKPADKLAVLQDLLRLPPGQRRAALGPLPVAAIRALIDEWWWQAHGGQAEPDTDWRVWAIVAGRGFGKTRAGAEWVWARAREDKEARIALVAATLDEVARVMVEGESGLIATARCDERPRWIASRGLLLFPSGAQAQAYSAERPDGLRGPQHHYAWCDELAKWPRSPGLPAGGPGRGQGRADHAWNNLMLGLRLGARPRTIVTTTPRPVPLLKRILAMALCHATRGRTGDNPHLPADFIAAMHAMFGGTRLGRQELEGLLLDEHEGALWSRELIERSRLILPGPGRGTAARSAVVEGDRGQAQAANPHHRSACGPPPLPGEGFHRVVVGLDPPASTHGDSCGIIVCGMDEAGVAWVLADLTASGLSPEAWARRVADAAACYGALKVVAEKNQGGDMIASVLRAVDADLPVRLVAATRSKAARAEPIALRFETGRARLAGHFPELEDQLCALTWSGYHGPGSPDRADAMVWAMTELFERGRGGPGVRAL
jgi:phage terminase large subunit-like protein